MLPNISAAVEENKLFHRITVRFLCNNSVDERMALLLATTMVQVAEKRNIEVKLIQEYIPESSTLEPSLYSKVSFSVLYKDDVAREKFLKIVKMENFWKKLDFTVNL